VEVVAILIWITASVVAFAFAVVTRRAAAWSAFVLLVLPAVFLWLAVRYGTR
jgi:hypothetical protein